jgi:dephospho-CoA kinase
LSQTKAHIPNYKQQRKGGQGMKVAIVGRIRSGKDTVGSMFIKDYGCFRMAFGDGIGRVIRDYFPEAFENGKPRRHYQHIGQRFRDLNPDVWVKDLGRTYQLLQDKGLTRFVVTDMRQMNEYHYLKSQGFMVVKVETADEIRLERMNANGDTFTLEDLNHETEQEIDQIPYDYLISNNTTLEDLYKQVQFVAEELKEEEQL